MSTLSASQRFLLVACALLASASLAVAQCGVPTNYANTHTLLSGSYIMYWTTHTGNSTLDMTITAQTNGWVGWGVAQPGALSMVPSEAVVGHLTSPATTATVYRLEQRNAANFVNITADIPLTNTFSCTFQKGSDTWSLVRFTRPLTGGNNPIYTNGTLTGMVAAFGESTVLQQHPANGRTTFTLDLNPAPAPTAPSTPSAPTTPTAPGTTPTTPTAPTAPTTTPTTPTVPTPNAASSLAQVGLLFVIALASLVAAVSAF